MCLSTLKRRGEYPYNWNMSVYSCDFSGSVQILFQKEVAEERTLLVPLLPEAPHAGPIRMQAGPTNAAQRWWGLDSGPAAATHGVGSCSSHAWSITVSCVLRGKKIKKAPERNAA